MSWFTRKKQNIEKNTKKDLPNDLWRKCSCGEILYNPELEASFSICHHCNFHFPITSEQYQDIILDKKSESLFSDISSIDMLGFKANKSYEEILETVPNNKEAVDCFLGEIEKRKVVLCIMNFKFIGGSMGSTVGEKISKAISLASEKNCPINAQERKKSQHSTNMAPTWTICTSMVVAPGLPLVRRSSMLMQA